jgi:hypothetical protein
MFFGPGMLVRGEQPGGAVQAIFDLEATNTELKPQLRDLYITSAKEHDFSGNARRAIVIHVRPETNMCCLFPFCIFFLCFTGHPLKYEFQASN